MTQLVIMDNNSSPIVSLRLGPEAPRFSVGGASWSEVKRPRRKALSEFESLGLSKLMVDTFLNAWPDGDAEPLIHLVESLMTPGPVQPPVLRLGGSVPHHGIRWVLVGVDDSGIVERRSDGRRCRQQLKLEFLEYSPADLVLAPPPPAVAAQQRATPAATSGSGGGQRTYTVKKGDTLWGIATSQLGKGSRWGEIANLNGVRDPKTIKPGQVLKLP